MSDFTPTTPISLQIRKIIFENFNDVDVKFTNDEIFEAIKKNGDFDPLWIIDDTESFFNDICNSGLARNIAQNFTTIWMKLFDPVEKNDVLGELGLEHLQAVRIKCALLSLKVLKSALYTYIGDNLKDTQNVDKLKEEAENLY